MPSIPFSRRTFEGHFFSFLTVSYTTCSSRVFDIVITVMVLSVQRRAMSFFFFNLCGLALRILAILCMYKVHQCTFLLSFSRLCAQTSFKVARELKFFITKRRNQNLSEFINSLHVNPSARDFRVSFLANQYLPTLQCMYIYYQSLLLWSIPG